MSASWETRVPPVVRHIIQSASIQHNVTPQMILSRRIDRPWAKLQLKDVVKARRTIIVDLRWSQQMSLTTIGKFLGGMHHSTVLYHLRQAARAHQRPCPNFDPELPDYSGEWAI